MIDIFTSLRIVSRALIRSTLKGRSNLASYREAKLLNLLVTMSATIILDPEETDRDGGC